MDEFNGDHELKFTANLEHDILSIQIEPFWQQLYIDLDFDVNKGLKYSSYHRGDEKEKSEIIVDEFQQVKDNIWVPKKARAVSPNEKGKHETYLEVLKVKVNDDIDPNLFKNFPWDDPKYNTKFGIRWEGNNQRRSNRIQFKDHPPSYFTSFFGLSLDEAYQLYLEIE